MASKHSWQTNELTAVTGKLRTVLTVACNFIGDGLPDALEVRLQRR